MTATLGFAIAGLSSVRPLRSTDECSTSTRFILKPTSEYSNHRRVSIRAVAAVVETWLPMKSLYEVLRLKLRASPTDIKSAYRSLAKVYHPDTAARRLPECDDRDFIEIRNAYDSLYDPSKRAVYDMSLMAVHGGRSRQYSASVTQKRYSGYYMNRRWETDQCW